MYHCRCAVLPASSSALTCPPLSACAPVVRLPCAQAAGLYRKGKQKRKQLTRTIIGLSVLTALLLLIIMALMFLVVWVMKDTSTSGAMLTTKDRSSALSTGGISQAVQVRPPTEE